MLCHTVKGRTNNFQVSNTLAIQINVPIVIFHDGCGHNDVDKAKMTRNSKPNKSLIYWENNL